MSDARAVAARLKVADRGGDRPLSFGEERLWFLTQFAPTSAAYNVASAWRLRGDLNREAIRAGLRQVMARHDVLRTTFHTDDDGPVLRVSSEVRFEFTEIEVPVHQSSDAPLRALVGSVAAESFDLAEGPVLRASLFSVGVDDHVLLVTVHHIVADGWSMGVLFEELGAFYRGFVTGESPGLPPLELQYGDYARWQRESLSGDALAGQLAYWRCELDGMATLELPTDRPRPPLQSYAGATHAFSLPADLGQQIAALAGGEGATLYMGLLAAFVALLGKYSGQEDIAVGTPIAGRTRPEFERLIGFFVNTLVLRGDLSGDPSFRELLARVRETALRAYEHQDAPFERVVAELNVDRDPSRNPLFQVMFALQNAPVGAFELPDAATAPFEFETGTTRFDLELHLSAAEDGGLFGSLVFNRDLFEVETVERLASHFRCLLERVVAEPERRLSELSLLSDAEARRLLVDWNATASPMRRATLHELFEEQARLGGDAVAVTSGEERWSYRELNGRANQLARYLRRLGVRRDSLVGVCMYRSPATVMALLGVLKAGAAYVPLDPGYPAERLRFMLEDSGVSVLLTEAAVLPRLPELGCPCVSLDADWDVVGEEAVGDLGLPVCAEGLAYVAYTSGSTGRPKAVLGTHSGIVNRFEWMWRTYPFGSSEVGLQRSSLSFVDSMWEIFGHLLAGVPIVIVSDETVRDPDQLAAAISAASATRVVLVPALLKSLVARADQLPTHSMVWSVSGEALPPELAEECEEALPNVRLLNLYGTSEVSADVTCDDESTRSRGHCTIGRPIANTETYVLDQWFRPVPVGVVGELFVGGVGLAHGYLGHPGLTAARFLPDPFSGRRGARIYRTGDRARILANGTLEYLGRADFQVKVRGFRIELGELETRLRAHAAISEAVVVAREDRPGDKRLVAYIVPAARDRVPTTSAVRDWLAQALPEYMLPAAIVVLDELPRTPSGKINRAALPPPSVDRPDLAGAYIPPRTPTEELLTQIWEATLGLERIGVEDNFFELGGSSLVAIALVAELEKALLIENPLRCLYTTPTVAAMARAVAGSRAACSDEVATDDPITSVPTPSDRAF